jgi:GNAT superfamily N-acetyltransferase
MSDLHLHIRRSRRTDFTAVMALLAACGNPVPPPDRVTLRRFRHIVADLGADFYLALVDGEIVGLVHVTYVRGLTMGQRAGLDQLLVAGAFRRRGIGAALLEFAQRRAQGRGCTALHCALPMESAGRRFLTKAGLHPVGEWFIKDLSNQPAA